MKADTTSIKQMINDLNRKIKLNLSIIFLIINKIQESFIWKLFYM